MRALLTFSVSPDSLWLLRQCFSHVTYLPPTAPDRHAQIHKELQNAQVFITTAKDLATLDPQEAPGEDLKVIQIGSAGVDAALKAGWLKSLVDSGRIARNGEEWKNQENGSEYSSYPLRCREKSKEVGSVSKMPAQVPSSSRGNADRDSSLTA